MKIIKYPSAIFLIAQATGMSLMEIVGRSQTRDICSKRQILIWFLWYEGISTDGITELTHRDRCTIIYSVKLIDKLISVNDRETIDLIDKINTLKSKYDNDNSY